MGRWADLEAADPILAEAGRRLLAADADRPPILATVRDHEPPRLHPVNVGIVDGALWTFVGPSAKLRDLVADGRYALHAYVDPARPAEFVVRGRARVTDDRQARAAVAATWPFTPDGAFRLFELDVTDASLGERPGPDAWPPIYRRWRADAPLALATPRRLRADTTRMGGRHAGFP